MSWLGQATKGANAMRVSLALLLLACLTGCIDLGSFDPCKPYRDALTDKQVRIALVEWADRNVFSRRFSDADSVTSTRRGPVGRYMNISAQVGPELLSGFASPVPVQIQGKDLAEPDLVFIGNLHFRGILISRRDFDSGLKAVGRDPAGVVQVSNRVALECKTPS